jgi:hypothetical protein
MITTMGIIIKDMRAKIKIKIIMMTIVVMCY